MPGKVNISYSPLRLKSTSEKGTSNESKFQLKPTLVLSNSSECDIKGGAGGLCIETPKSNLSARSNSNALERFDRKRNQVYVSTSSYRDITSIESKGSKSSDSDNVRFSRMSIMKRFVGGVHGNQNGIVHCDIRPENIMVNHTNEHWHATIIDWGTVSQVGTNMKGFTKSYLPSEIKNEAMKIASQSLDWYALGQTFNDIKLFKDTSIIRFLELCLSREFTSEQLLEHWNIAKSDVFKLSRSDVHDGDEVSRALSHAMFSVKEKGWKRKDVLKCLNSGSCEQYFKKEIESEKHGAFEWEFAHYLQKHCPDSQGILLPIAKVKKGSMGYRKFIVYPKLDMNLKKWKTDVDNKIIKADIRDCVHILDDVVNGLHTLHSISYF